MEINRKSIHMNRIKGTEEILIPLDAEYILPESHPPIKGKIKEQGNVVIEKVRAMDNKVCVSGCLKYELLYRCESEYDAVSEKLYFEEMIAMEGVTTQDIIKCVAVTEDLTIQVVHSGKISIKALIKLNVQANALSEKDVISSINTEQVQCKDRSVDITRLLASRKDIHRIKESIGIPKGMDTPAKVIWYELMPEGIDYRMRGNELELKGELVFFCVYSGSADGKIHTWSERIPFTEKQEMNSVGEDCYLDVNINTQEKNIILKADDNGEMRLLDLELILDMDVKAYGDESYLILEDAYSPNRNLQLKKEKILCENIALKNNMQCRIEERKAFNDRDAIGILNSMGTVHIEEVIKDSQGVIMEGGITVDIMYQKASEEDLMGFIRYKIPFSQRIDGIKDASDKKIACKSQSIKLETVLMNGEILIKALLAIDILVTETNEAECVCQIVDGEPDYKRIRELPGITGYIAGEGDSLWDIAKRYGTTVSKIMETNNLSSEEIRAGMKLLVVKSC